MIPRLPDARTTTSVASGSSLMGDAVGGLPELDLAVGHARFQHPAQHARGARLAAGRFAQRDVDVADRLVGLQHRRHVDVPGAVRGHELVGQVGQRETVFLQEGRALALPVIGEDEEVVRARRFPGHALQMGEDLVEGGQDLQRVLAVDPGVMRHLVIAEEGVVDRRHPAQQVGGQDVAARLLHGRSSCRRE